MPKSRRHMRSSRRAPTLRDEDYDHEISMLDQPSPRVLARTPSLETRATATGSTRSDLPLAQADGFQDGKAVCYTNGSPTNANANASEPPSSARGNQGPDIRVQPATPAADSNPVVRIDSRGKPIPKRYPPRPAKPEVAYDVLWENQRGGFFCGLPLFSSAALGNLDPPAWTNSLYKPSPTNIITAQVPDPSWEWRDPEWHIHHDESIGTDEEGWEYSFMFYRKFSWHGPRWFNSFVRRRAWIRYRVKKGAGYETNGVMGGDYFQVTPARQRHRSPTRGGSTSDRASSRSHTSQEPSPSGVSGDGHRLSHRLSRAFSQNGDADDASFEIPAEIPNIDRLMVLLKSSRIDREKLDAVETYVNTCEDELLNLQDHMHEIMGLFIFQASRKLLLARLTHLYDGLEGTQGKGKTPEELGTRGTNLAAAIKHADEEVRKLEYWSDIKDIAESGESTGAVDSSKGWSRGWDGLDKSGAQGPDQPGK